VTAEIVKELYKSPNGDRWFLCRNISGDLIVSHEPNRASGGGPSEIAVDVFLAHGGNGPEHQALVEALAALGLDVAVEWRGESSAEAVAKLSQALGQAVARSWSDLPQDIQQKLFEAAVTAAGEQVRQQLALFLHGKHARTVEQKRAMPEPDSLGG
jgi:hypothetical protein